MSPFWLGETLQAITTLIKSVTCNKSYLSSGSAAILVKLSPPIIKATFFRSVADLASFNKCLISKSLTELRINCYIEWSRRPAENPILIAVSILSPVSTQNIIPVSFKRIIASGTPSYNLSSIALDPIKVKFYSISSLNTANFFSLSIIEVDAKWNYFYQIS